MEMSKLEGIIEAILFTMGEAVPLNQLALAIDHDKDTTRKVVRILMDRYMGEDRGIQIIELEDSYQMCTKTELYEYLIKIAKQPRRAMLTDVLLETLAIITYRQPITKLEIEKIRGVKSDHPVNKLLEFNLVCEAGRMDAPGRPILFKTTEDFLRKFGIDSLKDLPGFQPDLLANFEEEAKEEIQLKLDL